MAASTTLGEKTITVVANKQRKVFSAASNPRVAPHVPAEVSEDPEIVDALRCLPSNYNFEVPKTIWRIRQLKSRRVALQFPEGLLIFALPIADILEKFTGCDVVVLGDVTYGACCIDDFTARALGCDLMVHYGHSCLIPVDRMEGLKMLYIFVNVEIDVLHLIQTIKRNWTPETSLALVGTIQFVSSIQSAVGDLKREGYRASAPQIRPLSPGEILGCTAPRLSGIDALIYVGDGRFHLEAVLIANPEVEAYRYDPYDKTLTEESYDHPEMVRVRRRAVVEGRSAGTFGVVLGTLGRQGNPEVAKRLVRRIAAKKRDAKCVCVLLSEIFPKKLELFSDVEAWVQTSCPRLSIDWGSAFSTPVLTPFEASVVLGDVPWQENYPMDYYARDSLGPWTPNHGRPKTEPSSSVGRESRDREKKESS